MTESNILFTLTFKQNCTLAVKWRRINNLQKIFQRELNTKATILLYIEYHKRKNGSPNYFAPHVHGVIKTDKHLSTYKIDCLESYFKTWGRSQWILQENPEEVKDWTEYIAKEYEENTLHNPTASHRRAFSIHTISVEKIIEQF